MAIPSDLTHRQPDCSLRWSECLTILARSTGDFFISELRELSRVIPAGDSSTDLNGDENSR
jgi:hypothetical protein